MGHTVDTPPSLSDRVAPIWEQHPRLPAEGNLPHHSASVYQLSLTQSFPPGPSVAQGAPQTQARLTPLPLPWYSSAMQLV